MKTQAINRTFIILGAAMLLLAGVLVMSATKAFSATNTAAGDIAGVSADLTNATFDISATQLALAKTAFITDGTTHTELTTGDAVPKGTTVYFMIYVDNSTEITVADVTMQDDLSNAAFTLNATAFSGANPLKYCTAATGTANGTVFDTCYDTGTELTAAISGVDEGSYTAGTQMVDIGNANEANKQLDVAANTIWAVIMEVEIN